MPEIEITVTHKIPMLTGPLRHVIEDNTDYLFRFNFDDEWNGLGLRTVFFADGASGTNYPVTMDGNECYMPQIRGWKTLLVGVQAGTLHTTRAAAMPVFTSITGEIGDPVPPEEFDKWTQIMARLLSPVDKTEAMTQPVGRDADGKLWVTPGNIRVVFDAETGNLIIGGIENA